MAARCDSEAEPDSRAAPRATRRLAQADEPDRPLVFDDGELVDAVLGHESERHVDRRFGSHGDGFGGHPLALAPRSDRTRPAKARTRSRAVKTPTKRKYSATSAEPTSRSRILSANSPSVLRKAPHVGPFAFGSTSGAMSCGSLVDGGRLLRHRLDLARPPAAKQDGCGRQGEEPDRSADPGGPLEATGECALVALLACVLAAVALLVLAEIVVVG